MTKRPLLWGWSVAMALMAPVASAQQAATPAAAEETDALTDKARQLYEEGRAAAAAGQWADAHASFLAAWAIKNHYQIASNLGVACLKLGKHRDAAEYLTRYLREAPASKVRERQAAEASLKEALAKVASVTVQVAPQGAEVTVDGAAVGRAPLPDPVFLDPGKHEIGARLEGHMPAKRPIEAAAGAAETVVLQLERRPAPDAGVGAGAGVVVGPVAPPPRDDVRTAVLVGGGIAAGAGVAAGVVLTVLSNGRASDAEGIRSALLKEWGGEHRCPSGDQTRCAELKTAVYDKYNLRSGAIWSFVAGGAIGVGTLVYGLVTMKPAEPAPRAQVAPFLGPGAAGMSLSGRF
ncbi:PEGA domain-containing protein [Sorangium sp. So ce1036]|uniref:PEGA domain-containing protein n=1 Tax=Sorangium sp. So ce1036 TaxID=3133328 RepID=UPI003F056112